MQEADRMRGLSSAIFTTIDTFYKQLVAEGKEVINLGIGSPDQPPAPHIVQALAEGIANHRHYGYPLSKGTPAFRGAVARWYGERFGVALDPETEVLALMGSQDGLAHLSLCYLDPGDVILVPEPGYPIYSAKAGVLVIPGNAFGACGEGFVRIALVAEEDQLTRVIERIHAYLA